MHLEQVLRAAGLRSEITSAIFMDCAREVAGWKDDLQGANHTRRGYVWSTAMELGYHYSQHAAQLHGSGIYGGLKDLACLPAIQVGMC